MPTVIEEKKPVVLVEYQFENREKLKSNCFRTIRILMQSRKNDMLVEYSPVSSVFPILVFDGGNRSCSG